jgi:hypothetical protein
VAAATRWATNLLAILLTNARFMLRRSVCTEI